MRPRGSVSRGDWSRQPTAHSVSIPRIDGTDNFATLATIDWQVHVYGAAEAKLAAWCAAQKLPLHVFEWRPGYEAAGFARDALYLLRPDTYVALADGSGAADAIERYFRDQGIKLPPRNAP